MRVTPIDLGPTPGRRVQEAITMAGHRPLFANVLTHEGARQVEIVGQYQGYQYLRTRRTGTNFHAHIHPDSIISFSVATAEEMVGKP